jgi:sterol desaturase/sphingolipid hydroxylase (fatty acid hydroxylase superfamily)
MAELDWWQQWIASLPYSERIVFVIGSFIAHIGTFWVLNIFLYFCYRNSWFMKYRIQGAQLPSWELIKECLQHVVFNQFIMQPIALYFAYPMFVRAGMDVRAAAPSVLTILRDFIVCIALNDTLFYWAHRTLHHGSIYKYIHKQHHRFKVNIGIASEFAHPVEDMLANVLPTIAGCLVMGSHPLTLWIWLVLRITETVDAHSGYNFPFSPFHALPFQGGADRHDFHHSHNVGCYGSFTIFWDWITGTDMQYLKFKEGKQVAKHD